MEHKKQHFIPQSYLRAWCDPETPELQTPYVWRFSKDGMEIKKKSPEKIFFENDMYTIKNTDGGRDLILERGLAGLESDFAVTRDKKIKERSALTDEERSVVYTFVAAMDARTKARRDHRASQWTEVLEKMERLKKKVDAMSPEERKRYARPELPTSGPSYGYEEVKQIAAKPIQNLLVAELAALASHLVQMEMVIIETNSTPGFITTDNPCVWFDPEACKRPPAFQAPALMYPSTEIRLPLSPTQMLVFKRNFGNLSGYIPVDDWLVDDINRITRFNAYEHFVVNANVKKEIWFDQGVEPEDSWNRKQSTK